MQFSSLHGYGLGSTANGQLWSQHEHKHKQHSDIKETKTAKTGKLRLLTIRHEALKYLQVNKQNLRLKQLEVKGSE
jgi:hypothetical protein